MEKPPPPLAQTLPSSDGSPRAGTVVAELESDKRAPPPLAGEQTWPLGVIREDLENHLAGEPPALELPRRAHRPSATATTAFAHVISAARRRTTTAPRSPSALRTPALPTPAAPSEALWPPTEAREVLRQVCEHALLARLDSSGQWIADAGPWRVRSAPCHELASYESGRQELLSWAREHTLLAAALSPGRVLVLADTGAGTWRLWQVVGVHPTLRDRLLEAAADPLPQLYGRLTEAAQLLCEGIEHTRPTRLRPTLDNFGPGHSSGRFVAPLPSPHDIVPPPSNEPHREAATQLAAVLAGELATRCQELITRAAELWQGPAPWDAVVSAALVAAYRRLDG